LKKKKTKTFYIHTSGCGMLTYKALPNEERYGKTYDDIEDLEELHHFPREAIHRDVEEIVIELAQFNPELIKVAIVSPPGIYGRGRGPINTHAMVIPFFSQMLLKAGHGFISEPLCGWDHVHVHDLSRLFLILAEAADAGGGKAQWGKEGYYFADAGHIPWKEFMQRLATEAKLAGYIESDELKTYGTDEITKTIGEFASMLNSNEKSRGSRTRKVLGWEPTETPFLETVAEGLRIEAEKMGK
jgi:nucleoside-diphosphate-sugar epimerase